MSDDNRFKPFDPNSRLGGCSCGAHASQAEHDAARPGGTEHLSNDIVEASAMKALIPNDRTRRRFLLAVGGTAAAAALYSVLPIRSLQEMAGGDKVGPLERRALRVGFLPINCATPLIMADPMGFYKREGLEVSLVKTPGWALVRDHMLNGELDASHFLAPMPLAISMGLASQAQPMRVASIQNVNGQAITLALKHRNNRDPKNWKGFKFAIPFDFSMHNFLLRYYLAEHGLDPDKDVQLRVTPPAEMIANLRAGNIDGFLGPEPFNQRAVFDEIGFIHILTKDIWEGHPCCAFGASESFIQKNPNSFQALYRAILKATSEAEKPENRADIAKAISGPKYLNQPETVIAQGLTGHFADGLGEVRNDPQRAGFEPLPWYSMATWMLTQMKRWGYIKQDVDYRQLAEKVFLLTDARRLMKDLDLDAPQTRSDPAGYPGFKVMGRAFDPATPEAYLNQFPIKRS